MYSARTIKEKKWMVEMKDALRKHNMTVPQASHLALNQCLKLPETLMA